MVRCCVMYTVGSFGAKNKDILQRLKFNTYNPLDYIASWWLHGDKANVMLTEKL